MFPPVFLHSWTPSETHERTYWGHLLWLLWWSIWNYCSAPLSKKIVGVCFATPAANNEKMIRFADFKCETTVWCIKECPYYALHFCEVWTVEQSVETTERSSVGVCTANLLPPSLKHTQTQTYTHICTHMVTYKLHTHTYKLPTASICSYLCSEMRRRAERYGWMDGSVDGERKKEWREERNRVDG